MILEQVFYGRGPQGYAVLGDSGCPLDLMEHAEALCQQHGTPDVDSMSRLQPFLFQHCSCGHVYMGCGMAGRKDDLGRETLFFHVLIGNAEEFVKAGVCAADLFRLGLFASGQGQGAMKLGKVEVDECELKRQDVVSRCALELPAVVLCKSESNRQVLKLIGDAVSKVGWTSCSWNASGNFEVVGMPSLISLDSAPAQFNVYDENGKLLRKRAGQDRLAGEGGGGLADAVEVPQGERATPGLRKNFGGAALVTVFFVGLALGMLVCGMIGRSARCPGAKVVRFDKDFRIERQELQSFLNALDGPSGLFLQKMKKYYDFVEENFPETK